MMSLFSTTARCICCNISNRTLHKVRLLSTPTALENSFHKRVLPSSLIALNSTEGKKVFIEALEEGNMESYFPLAEQFMTQSEPAYCAVTSLAMVMNALNHDPQRVWKGVWRWVSDEMLQCETKGECGHSLEKVKKEGMNFREFETLAECHGVKMQAYRVPLARVAGGDVTISPDVHHHHSCLRDHKHGEGTCTSPTEILCSDRKLFESQLHAISSSSMGTSFIIANYSRKAMDQTGDGHFSPIGGYNRARGLVLIMDVARFKYPPYWTKLDTLWASMSRADNATGSSRGYFVVSADHCYLPIHGGDDSDDTK